MSHHSKSSFFHLGFEIPLPRASSLQLVADCGCRISTSLHFATPRTGISAFVRFRYFLQLLVPVDKQLRFRRNLTAPVFDKSFDSQLGSCNSKFGDFEIEPTRLADLADSPFVNFHTAYSAADTRLGASKQAEEARKIAGKESAGWNCSRHK